MHIFKCVSSCFLFALLLATSAAPAVAATSTPLYAYPPSAPASAPKSLTDVHGYVWSITAAGQAAVNGVADLTTSNVSVLVYLSGKLWMENSANLWYVKDGWAEEAPPATTTVLAYPPGAPAGDPKSFTDTVGDVWTITSQAEAAVNGVADKTTHHVVLLAYSSGKVWQENSSSLWYVQKGWVNGSNPLTTPVIATASGAVKSITDGMGNVWSITASGQVAVNGVADTTTKNVVELVYVLGDIWEEDSSGHWWDKVLPSASWVAASNPVPGSGGGTTGAGAPSAPTAFEMTHQGASSVSFTWAAAVPGANPISYYKIYRNGASYATTTALSYTDTNAPNITTPGYGPEPFVPATIYSYTVSAVDTKGTESPQQNQCVAWVYHKGLDSWTTSIDSYNGGVTVNTADTSGEPEDGTTDISIKEGGGSNYWQPFSGPPFLTTSPPTWVMELGMFNYMTIDLKPTVNGQIWRLNIVSRITTGDNYNSAQVILGDGANFGPASVAGKWATYKIPFLPQSGDADGTSLEIGVGKYSGSISGNVLTVASMGSGLNVQGSSFLSGAGIAQGSNGISGTYLGGTQTTQGGLGTYTVFPAQSTSMTEITAQRTNMYKFGLIDPAGQAGTVYYVDNVGFTTK